MPKLIKSTAKRIGAIDSAEFNFNGKTAVIIGKNAAGKSTIISALANFLRGLKGAELLQQGKQSGTLEYLLDSGDRFVLEAKKGKSPTAKFITADGKKQAATKAISEKYFPPQIDLNHFINQTPAKQREILTKTLGVNCSHLDAEEKKLTDERKEIGQEKKRLESLIKSAGEYNAELPEKEQSAKDVLAWIQAANDRNNAIGGYKKGLQDLEAKRDANAEQIEQLKEKITQLEQANAELNTRINNGNAWLAAPENQPVPAAQVKEETKNLTNLEEVNKQIRENNQIRANRVLLDTESDKYNAYTAKIEAVRFEKTELFKQANLPENIEITDTGILVDGLPLVNNQHARSVIGIAELKLAHATMGAAEWLTFDAASLDRANLAAIIAWGESVGVQLLIEQPNKGSEADDALHFEIVEG